MVGYVTDRGNFAANVGSHRGFGLNCLVQRWPQIAQMVDVDDTETIFFILETAGEGGDT